MAGSDLPRRRDVNNFEALNRRAVVYPVFRVLFPNQVIPADQLARAMVDIVVLEAARRASVVLENRDIRAMAERSLP